MSRRNAEDEQWRIAVWLLLALLVPGLVSAFVLAVRRHNVESANRSVEIVLDFTELQHLAASSGTPLEDILTQFEAVGVSGVAVGEDILGDLAQTGQVAMTEYTTSRGMVTAVRAAAPELNDRIRRSLRSRVPSGMIAGDAEGLVLPEVPYHEHSNPYVFHGPLAKTVVVSVPPATLRTMGIGLPPEAVSIVRKAGLEVVARLQNNPVITLEAIDAGLVELKHDGVGKIIFSGEEVYGFRGLVPYAAKRLRKEGLVYGSIEFARQKGDARMSGELEGELVRVHSISAAEMAPMSPREVVERFARAVKERNIRVCYVRLISLSDETPVHTNIELVSEIREAVAKAGYSMGTAHPLPQMYRPPLMLLLIALSIVAAGLLLLASLVSSPPRGSLGWALLGVCLALIAIAASYLELGRQLLALTAALIFPTLAITAVVGPHFNHKEPGGSPVVKAVWLFVGTAAITAMGALMVIGLLADRSYMVKVLQFTGIKAAHLLPILAVVFFMVAGLPMLGKPLPQIREEVGANLRSVARHPLFVWHVLAVVIALGIIGVALMRTGNDSGLGVSGLELRFRSILDQLVAVRPRTKEFLIGHPALFVGIALLLSKRRAWGLPLVALGTLGQVSLLNTFCHIHSPLGLSMVRALNGLVLGLLIGLLAWYLVRRPPHGSTEGTDCPDEVTGGRQ